MKNKQLGQILLDAEKISAEQIEQALVYQREHKVYMGKAILSLGMLTESELMKTLSVQLGIPYVELMDYELQDEAIVTFTENFARENNVMPLFILGKELSVAISDPLNINLVDELNANQNGYSVNLVLATESAIVYAIDLYYGASKYIKTEEKSEGEQEGMRVVSKELDEETQAAEATNLLLREGIKIGASDIHIEPRSNDVRIRFRVDGVLQQYYTLPKSSMNALISRVKILAGMDIAESRKPQDGRFTHIEGEDKIDLRTSTFPTPNGEKVVMRMLDEKKGRIELNKLGFEKNIIGQWQKVIHQPNGIVLVSGPTGSGKTTTLYATLNLINSVEVNIMTVEDPIEYVLENINQSQVNPRAGVTFTAALRTMLRQDPDIIFVGEMRDVETIELAIRAALTGHLVFSTIHTNDAASSITRMLDMGLDPYLITSTVRAILAQRLIRLLCPRCKRSVEISAETKNILGDVQFKGKIHEPAGCVHCRNSGYFGRSAIFELMQMDSKIAKLILSRATAKEIEAQAVKAGMKTLKEAALDYIKNGRTSINEFARILSL